MDKLERSYHFSQAAGMMDPIAAALAPAVEKACPVSDCKGISLYTVGLWLCMALAINACAVAAVAHMMIGMNNDHLDLMDQVRRWMAGGKPYVAFADINPPLIHMLYVFPFLLSKWPGLPLDVALHGVTLLLIGLSLLVSGHIMRFSEVPIVSRRVVLASVALALLCVSFIDQPFADRDHVMMVLVSPWLVLYSPLARRELIPVKWRVVAALMGAIGFAIKPYFYVLYLASTGFSLFRNVSPLGLLRQWEHKVVVGFALLYAAIVYTFFPEYPNVMLPLAWHTYGSLQWSWDSKQDVLTGTLLGGYAMVGLAATLVLLLTARSACDSAIAYLFVLLGAAALLYAMQAGWYYTQYPFIAIALVLAISAGSKIIYAYGRIAANSKNAFALVGAYGLLAAGLVQYFAVPIVSRAVLDIHTQHERGHPFAILEMSRAAALKVEPYFAGHPRFMFFTNDLRGVNLMRAGTPRVNVGRFDYLWSLPGTWAMKDKPGEAVLYDHAANYLFSALAHDLDYAKPDMVINDVSTFQYALPAHYNIIPWMKTSPLFSRAWRAYTLVDSFDTCTPQDEYNCAYEIYYRK